MKSFVYIFAALTTLASAQQSQVDIQANKIINDITYGIKKVTECNVDQKNTALGQIIYKDLIVFNEASENKFELATSDKKINNEQKKQLIEFAKDTNKCKELSNQLFVNYPKILLVRMNFSNKSEVELIRLLKKESTIGEFNSARLQLLNEASIQFKTIISEMDAEIARAKSLESSQQRQFAIQEQTRQQQLAIQQAQIQNQKNLDVLNLIQQNNLNSQAIQQQSVNNFNKAMTTPKLTTPSLNSPSETDCTYSGNTINCKTH